MTDLILLLQADLDIQAAFGRYEEYQTGRGEVFMRQLDAAFTLLRRYPEIAPVYMGPYRRMLIRNFPLCRAKAAEDEQSKHCTPSSQPSPQGEGDCVNLFLNDSLSLLQHFAGQIETLEYPAQQPDANARFDQEKGGGDRAAQQHTQRGREQVGAYPVNNGESRGGGRQ